MTERVEYIVENTENGKEVFIGRSVNYHVCGQASSLDDLKIKMKAMINMWLKFGADTMAKEEPIELKSITKEEWESQYAEWIKTSKWVHIADALYDTIRDLVGDKWTNSAIEMYEKNTTRKAITDKVSDNR